MDYKKANRHWTNATSFEKVFFSSRPWLVDDIEKALRDATSETIRRFSHNGHNDESDAFRHC